jgi:hypothetical protein
LILIALGVVEIIILTLLGLFFIADDAYISGKKSLRSLFLFRLT